MLEILRKHPYVFSRDKLAFMRALCCERIGDYFGAAVFFADSWHFGVPRENPSVIFLAAGYCYVLVHQKKFPEAVRCVRYQLKHIPHAITSTNASLLRYAQ